VISVWGELWNQLHHTDSSLDNRQEIILQAEVRHHGKNSTHSNKGYSFITNYKKAQFHSTKEPTSTNNLKLNNYNLENAAISMLYCKLKSITSYNNWICTW
jgi:ATP-dependent helicase/DNAse subunit B